MWHPIACWSDPADTDGAIRVGARGIGGNAAVHDRRRLPQLRAGRGEGHVRAGYSPEKYTRLVALKDKYDPNNLFQINQNIAPSPASAR